MSNDVNIDYLSDNDDYSCRQDLNLSDGSVIRDVPMALANLLLCMNLRIHELETKLERI